MSPLRTIGRFFSALKVSAAAVVTFILFATATAAFAESKNFGPCLVGRSAMGATTAYQFGQYQSQTTQNNSGCVFLSVRLRRWFIGLGNPQMLQEVYADGANHGHAYTDWVGLGIYSDNIYVAQHAAKAAEIATYYTWTSDDGSHSTIQWFCNGQSGGSSGFCAPP